MPCVLPAFSLVYWLFVNVLKRAEGIRLTIEGAKQGHFKGNVAGRDKEQISAIKFAYEVDSPRDVATG